MNRNEWIRSEIAVWRSEGVIGEELAARLLGRYSEQGARLSWGAMLAGGFGALMIGLGVIALFAANWNCFGRGARAVIAMAPVIACGIVAMVASRKRWTTMALWEPLGILWCIATCAAACLVAQTYQLGGSVPGLILLVALLTLPIVWVTRSVMGMALWPIFAIAWGIATEDIEGGSLSIVVRALALMALSIPALVAFLRRNATKAARITGRWVSGLVYALGTPVLIVNALPHLNYSIRMEADIGVFWLCSLVVLLVGIGCKIRAWPMVATLVAAGAATCTAIEAEVWIYCLALLLAGGIIAWGVNRIRLSYTNIGAALFLWLVLAKFFESRVDFTVKGIVLIMAGVVLTVLNVAMIKSKKGRTENAE